MSNTVLDHLSRGKFVFLRPDSDAMRRALPNADSLLPMPQKIFLADETATPLIGYPVLISHDLQRLRQALNGYLEAEEAAQLAYVQRSTFDSKAYARSWDNYRQLLSKTVANTMASHQGYGYSAVFWLDHSLGVSRFIQDLPKRLRRTDSTIARDHGDTIKYKVLTRWSDRAVDLTYDLAKELGSELDEGEASLFPRVLEAMRDNVLVLSEDFISQDLTELSSYFHGYLQMDGRAFRQRLRQLDDWHAKQLRRDPLLRAAAEHLLGGEVEGDGNRLLRRAGYLSFLSQHPGYELQRFFSQEQIKVWAGLLEKIKQFEILHTTRKLLVPVTEEDGELVCRDRSFNSTWVGGPAVLKLSPATRPIDFTAPWVVDPVVQRFGLVYDITDFSATISLLGRSRKSELEDAFRMTSRFQRQVNRTATELGLRLEKYLGDGAFYSGRYPRRLLALALALQRIYPEFVDQGFPFDRGMRIALNFGEYHLLLLESTDPGGAARFEFFGHGLVELSRLSTGKRTQELDSFKTYLISQGYPETTVNKFFAPLVNRSADVVSRIDEARRFYAYINQTGTLINEGIVASESFIRRLGSFPEMRYLIHQGRGFIAVHLGEHAGDALRIGIRKLGPAHFKGLEPQPVYEIVDGREWNFDDAKPIQAQSLLSALNHLFTRTVTAAQRRARDARRDQTAETT